MATRYAVRGAGDQSQGRRRPSAQSRPLSHAGGGVNVSSNERIVSFAAGAILALLGMGRRDWKGLLIGGVGSGLMLRGATGRCPVSRALGVDTASDEAKSVRKSGIHVVETFLINKQPDELYAFWRELENLPTIMTHLKSVKRLDDRRSHWIAKAPSLVGGEVEWDAETVADEPNSRLQWRSLPGAIVAHQGSVQFTRAPGDRGTAVRVALDYAPPGGQIGRWAAKLFGEEPEQQIREDLRNFKRIMETGEIPTIAGQPRGTCIGR
jgi:uncharacterized membrane protein